jgi:hypothetical protein
MCRKQLTNRWIASESADDHQETGFRDVINLSVTNILMFCCLCKEWDFLFDSNFLYSSLISVSYWCKNGSFLN